MIGILITLIFCWFMFATIYTTIRSVQYGKRIKALEEKKQNEALAQVKEALNKNSLDQVVDKIKGGSND